MKTTASKTVATRRAENAGARAERAGRIVASMHRAAPEPRVELVHSRPFELLVATILSAQCTDARVNMVTPDLFAAYPDAAAMASARPVDLERLIRSTGFYRAKTRSISAENPTGEKGKGGMAEPEPSGPARELGRGWKCRPFVRVQPGETSTLAYIEGPGAIQSMWITGSVVSRDFILRFHWDGQAQPSVECPLPDFFATPWAMQDQQHLTRGPFTPVNSLPVSVNPTRGHNCFWEMPFKKRCHITLENRHPMYSVKPYILCSPTAH